MKMKKQEDVLVFMCKVSAIETGPRGGALFETHNRRHCIISLSSDDDRVSKEEEEVCCVGTR